MANYLVGQDGKLKDSDRANLKTGDTIYSGGGTGTVGADGNITWDTSSKTKDYNSVLASYNKAQTASGGQTAKPQGAFNTTAYDPNGNAQGAYIANGQTYLNNGERLQDGWSVYDKAGNYYTMAGGKGVLNSNVEKPYEINFKSGSYRGNRLVDIDGLTVDMSKDYSALMQQYANDPDALKYLERLRNAKVKALQNAGITDVDATNDFDNVNYTGVYDYTKDADAFAENQNDLRDAEIAAINGEATTALNALDLQKQQAEEAYLQNARQNWTNAQLANLQRKEALAANGITGGGAETAQIGADTAYQTLYGSTINAYSDALTKLQAQRAEIQNNLASNVKAIRKVYGDAVANAYAEAASKRDKEAASAEASIRARIGL